MTPEYPHQMGAPPANRTDQTVQAGTCNTFHQAVNAKNQFLGGSYDAAGNLLGDGVHSYSYDAENRITYVDSGNTATYVYNALGQRVAKGTPSGTTFYIYGTDGQVVAERDAHDNWIQTYIYFGGKPFGLYRNSNTGFIFSDHLGSTRLVTLSDDSVYDSLDYLPFGEQIAGGSATSHKFTGKERDGESGLDDFGARYFGSSLGRFMSPDAANIAGDLDDSANPQSWNAYAYVRNNPINAVDPNGEDCVYAGDFKNSGTVLIERGDTCSKSNGTYVEGHIDENSFVYDQKNNQLTYNVSDTGASGVISVGPSRAGISDSDRFGAVQMGVGLGEQGVNWAVRTTLINAGGAVAGGLIRYGVEAILAAREATALAEGAVDLQNVSSKIIRQMSTRGWTKQAVVDTIKEAQQGGTTYSAINKATGGAATEYVSQSTGRFVVIDNTTKQVIQVSGPGFKPNYMAKP